MAACDSRGLDPAGPFQTYVPKSRRCLSRALDFSSYSPPAPSELSFHLGLFILHWRKPKKDSRGFAAPCWSQDSIQTRLHNATGREGKQLFPNGDLPQGSPWQNRGLTLDPNTFHGVGSFRKIMNKKVKHPPSC